ncbi:hypothetical protein [Clostridium sp. SGI.024]|uniref:hypothetical protein n=1 Tax=Clostridium sp. SGI.024 TaxID=3420551 RepID=UPI003D07118D
MKRKIVIPLVLVLVAVLGIVVFQTRNISRKEMLIFTPTKGEKITVIKEKDDKLQYSVYSYGGDVEIDLKGETLSLSKALNENKITMDEILDEVISDVKKGVADATTIKDGGSQIYEYKKYTIVKFHSLDGNNDFYIGSSNFDINELYKNVK